MTLLTNRILQSIVYASIFQYPMTRRELFRWVSTSKQISQHSLHEALQTLIKKGKVTHITPFFMLPGHKFHIGIHAQRLVYSQEKWKKAHRIARILHFVPTVVYVGVTGSLAMNNANHDDDIDLCIVSAKGTVWITRFLVTLLVEVFAKRRHPMATHVKDAICLNMFLSEQALEISEEERDEYIAHELLQMIPLWERKGIEKKWLLNNQWVKQYYYVAYHERLRLRVRRIKQHKQWESFFRYLEQPARCLQLHYMKKRRTTEVVTDTIIRFHPKDMRRIVLTVLHRNLALHNIPLDKKSKQI